MSTGRAIPVTRSTGVEEGLAARLADPLWLLARQWQFGEFRGDDAGSPTSVTFSGMAFQPTWWRPEPQPDTPAARPWLPWTVADGPLDTLIEAEPDDGTAWMRLRLDGGARARRMLLAAGLPEFTTHLRTLAAWPENGPQPATVIDSFAMTACPDGQALADLVQPWAAVGTPLPAAVAATLAGTAAQQDTFATTMRAWLAWWTPRAAAVGHTAVAQPDPPAWDPHRLEHSGTLAFGAAPTLRLHVDRYPGGGVDWYAADVTTGEPGDLPAAAAPADFDTPITLVQNSIALPTSFAGMAAPRFWEFEDATVDYGSIDASPADLARLLLVQFTTVYGNDWFSIPLRLPVGSLVRVDAVRVTDSFGGVYSLGPFAASSAGWRMYSLRAPQDRPEYAVDYFWCAPTLSGRLASPETERVTLRRDEMANTAWGVVEQITDPFGRSVPEPADRPVMPAITVPPQYLVETPIADNLYPLSPDPVGIASIRLKLQGVIRRSGDVETEANAPGVILSGDWWIHEEELPRAGLTLDRQVRLARWHDGSLVRWVGRSVWPGVGEMSSGLLWDTVVE